MMNFVALFLVVSSLVTAGVWSPSASPTNDQTQQQKQRQETHQQQHARDQEIIVKNGHRVVVVEYDEHGHHKTKVSISPETDHPLGKESSSFSDNELSSPSKISRAFDKSMENSKEAASGLPNFGQGHGEGHSPKEHMCDAYGKCKHKIASAIENRKEICRETAHEAKEICKETAHGAKEAAHKVREAAHGIGEAVKDEYERAKDTVSDTVHKVEETARDTMEKAKNAAKTAKETGDTLAGDIQRNVSRRREDLAEKAKEAKETAEEAAGKMKAGAEELKSGTQKRLHQLSDKGRGFWYGAFGSIALGDLLEGLMSVAHLFGLATAYGMCMWITFVSSHVLAGSLPREQFGMVQSKIYEVYFKAMVYSVGLALLGHLWRHRSSLFRGKAADMLQNYNLIAAFSMILFNMMYLEPRSTKLMFERMKIEKEEGRGIERVHAARISREAGQQQTTAEGEPSVTTPPQVPRREQQVVEPDLERLNKMSWRLKQLNSYSSFLNIASLMALSWHLVYLAQHLPSSCC